MGEHVYIQWIIIHNQCRYLSILSTNQTKITYHFIPLSLNHILHVSISTVRVFTTTEIPSYHICYISHFDIFYMVLNVHINGMRMF